MYNFEIIIVLTLHISLCVECLISRKIFQMRTKYLTAGCQKCNLNTCNEQRYRWWNQLLDTSNYIHVTDESFKAMQYGWHNSNNTHYLTK